MEERLEFYMLPWQTVLPAQFEQTKIWQPTPEQRTKAIRFGVSFQLRYKDGGPDRRDEYYIMAWFPKGEEREGSSVESWEEVVQLAKKYGIKLEEE